VLAQAPLNDGFLAAPAPTSWLSKALPMIYKRLKTAQRYIFYIWLFLMFFFSRMGYKKYVVFGKTYSGVIRKRDLAHAIKKTIEGMLMNVYVNECMRKREKNVNE
jgi:hypothetical protein